MQGKPVILCTRRFPDAVEKRLKRDYAPRLNPSDAPLPAAGLAAWAEGCEALLVTPTDRIDATVIGALPDSVRAIATFSVGHEHIDVAAARARGIIVTNTPGVLTEATAEIALLLMLGAARRASEGERMLRGDAWTGWAPTQLLGTQLTGKRLGILGMGRIGQTVAGMARALGMEIHYHNRRPVSADEAGDATYHATAEDLFKVAQVLSIHCPATPETRKLMDADRLALLPAGAIIVNTARGVIIDDDALIAALHSGHVAAAGLDVFDGEPAIHPGYRDLANAFLLPHLGSATVETRNAMGFKALDNLDAIFARRQPPDALTG